MLTNHEHLYFKGDPCAKCNGTLRYRNTTDCVVCRSEHSRNQRRKGVGYKDQFVQEHKKQFVKWLKKVKRAEADAEVARFSDAK